MREERDGEGEEKREERAEQEEGKEGGRSEGGGRKDSSCDLDKTWSLFLISKVDEMSSPKDTTISLGLF